MNTLLVVDDNEDIRQQLRWGLSRESYDILFAENAQQALALFQEHRPSVVTLDLGLPPFTEDAREGLRCLKEILAQEPATKVIVITGFEDTANARAAVETGAYDFFRKPVNLDDLRVMIRRAFMLHEIEGAQETAAPCKTEAPNTLGIIGDCPEMHKVYALIEKVAASDAPVLITGESGTGKELIARALHTRSARHASEMISINCGAIPENLVESEFFGHEKGAFTGATSTVPGKVEFANNSTLFLDEIGDLPIQLQVKFLRFLQEMTFMRVGGRKTITVNVRIVAATNVDIKQHIKEGRFREDLFYRLGVITLHLPPLRQRGDDVRLLANYFLQKYAAEAGKPHMTLQPEAETLIQTYPWPGNVRELENSIRRACLLASGTRLGVDDLGISEQAPDSHAMGFEATTLREARTIVEKRMVESALVRHGGNIQRTANALGISRPTLYDLIRKHEIEI